MKTRGKVLLFTLLAAAFLMSAQFVHAYNYSGAWLANSDDVFTIKFSGSTTFSVYDWNDPTNNIKLLSSSGDVAVFSITDVGGSYKLTYGTQTITLGATAEFGFFFGDKGLTYDLIGQGIDAYKLTFTPTPNSINADNYTTRPLTTIVYVHDANPVPIPPSALLLGSGVLGMIGFGFRRKSRKA